MGKYEKLQPSTVGAGAQMRLDPTRTSESAFVGGSAEAMAIKRRAFDVLRIAPFDDDQVGGLQVLRYATKQAYRQHHDYFPADTTGSGDDGFSFDSHNGGSNRFATLLVFLSDVDVGGALTFPDAVRGKHADVGSPEQRSAERAALEALQRNGTMDRGSWEWEMSNTCASDGSLSVRPVRGSAVLFYSQHADGRLDPLSLHGSCPVLGSMYKWAANVWVWNKRRVHHDPSKAKMHGGNGDGSASAELQDGQVELHFHNNCKEKVAIFWQMPESQGGDPTFWSDIYPGQSAGSTTWHTHRWLAKTGGKDGEVVWRHTASAKDESGSKVNICGSGKDKDEL